MTLYELNSAAFNQSKQRKRDAMAAIEQLATSIEPDTPEARQIAKAYQYFTGTIPVPKKAKTTFDWIARAADRTDKHNYRMDYVAADDTYIVATDGRRMHLAPTDGRPQGLYHPRTGHQVADSIDGYLNYRRAMPPNEFTDKIHIDDVSVLEAASDTYRTSVVSESGAIYYVNKRYLLDACDNASNTLTLDATVPDKPVVIEYEDGRRAIIMPMQPPKA